MPRFSKHIFFFSLLVCSLHSIAQEIELSPFTLKGTTKSGGKTLDGVNIVLSKDGKQIENKTTDKKGYFQFRIPLTTNSQSTHYTVFFSKPGYVSKTLDVSTYVPESEYDGTDFELTLFEVNMPPTKYSHIKIERPYGKALYIKKVGGFDLDEQYAKSIEKEEWDLKKDPDKFLLDYEQKKKNGQVTTNPVDDKKAKYDAAIKNGDGQFKAKSWEQAKLDYEEALKHKPGDAHALSQIKKCDEEINKIFMAKYNELFAKAETAFKAQKWDDAKKNYEDALKYKPNDKPAKDRINECDAKILAANSSKSVEEKYKAEMAKGDNANKIKNFAEAINAFTEALKLKKADVAATKKLNGAKSDLAKQKTKYDAAMLKGNNALKAKKYDEAKVAYNEALAANPNEKQPKDKIAEADRLKNDELAKNDTKNKAAYDAAIAKGNNAIAAKNYVAAKAAFNEAAKLKPAESLPKNKLAEVDKLIAADKSSAEKQYQAFINIANEAMANKNYQGAIDAYKEASNVKPNERLPKDKIAEAKALMDKNSVAVNNNPNNGIDTVGQSSTNTNDVNNQSTPEEIAISKGPVFNADRVFSDAKERQKIQEQKRKFEKKKAQNLTLKYETRNMTTSLLDAVDSYEKNNKKK